ncbi:hypothetical protein BDQ17DRAFT_1345794 [Cyathus striatus]|nr:hypothetical protein BDQ17DRAFT_1345794 [Cyathus striatus]
MAVKGRPVILLLNKVKSRAHESVEIVSDVDDVIHEATIFFEKATLLAQKVRTHGWAKRCLYGAYYRHLEAKLQRDLDTLYHNLDSALILQTQNVTFQIREKQMAGVSEH